MESDQNNQNTETPNNKEKDNCSDQDSQQKSCCSGSDKSSGGCCGGSSSCCSISEYCDVDVKWVGEKIQTVMLSPKECWQGIKEENLTPKNLYKKYLVPLCILASICSFIGSSIIGFSVGLGTTYRVPVVSGFIFQIVALGVSLLGYALVAFIIEKLAPKFNTEVSFQRALLLVGFSATPGLLAGIFSLFPSGLFAFVAIVLSIYSVYVFWNGFENMTGVQPDKKIGFFVSALVSSIIAMFILNFVAAALFQPKMPQEMFDQKQLEESIKKLVPEGK